MRVYYKGAGPGSYLAINSPKLNGIKCRDGGIAHSVNRMINHIVHGTTYSPYISLTSSYGIAEGYAATGVGAIANPNNPGFVYEIEFDDTPLVGFTVIDPIKEISKGSNPPSPINYHHDGNNEFVLGVISPSLLGGCLVAPVRHPPNSGATQRAANLSRELECIARVIRDSEVLVLGNIPSKYIVSVHP